MVLEISVSRFENNTENTCSHFQCSGKKPLPGVQLVRAQWEKQQAKN